MNEYEQAVLNAVARGPDYVGWYKIEQRLSVMDIPSREYLPDALQKLLEQGLIEENSVNRGTYRATARGRSVLASSG
jgi:hypothetical protein